MACELKAFDPLQIYWPASESATLFITSEFAFCSTLNGSSSVPFFVHVTVIGGLPWKSHVIFRRAPRNASTVSLWEGFIFMTSLSVRKENKLLTVLIGSEITKYSKDTRKWQHVNKLYSWSFNVKCFSSNWLINTVFYLRIKGELKRERGFITLFPWKEWDGEGGLIRGFTESVYKYQWALGASDQFKFLGNCSPTPPLS